MSLNPDHDDPPSMQPSEARPTSVEFASFRVYREKDGRYRAFGTCERTDSDVKVARLPIVEGGSHETPAAALAEVLGLSGFVK